MAQYQVTSYGAKDARTHMLGVYGLTPTHVVPYQVTECGGVKLGGTGVCSWEARGCEAGRHLGATSDPKDSRTRGVALVARHVALDTA